jgi:putative DNA primase/helicase
LVAIFRRLWNGHSQSIIETETGGATQAMSSLHSRVAKSLVPTEDGGRLLDEIAVAVRQHVWLPDGAAELITLFVVHAHAHDAAAMSPILSIESPEVRCGKTTLLRVLSALTPSPLSTSNITAAGLYRTISRGKCTLLIDEGNSFLLGGNEVRGILNSGHCRESAFVVRADGVFNVWCPKAVALIGEPPASLRDRSIRIGLQRRLPNEKIIPLDGPAIDRLKQLGERLAPWTEANRVRLGAANPAIPAALNNRTADNWRALLAIADIAGDRWPQRARQVAVMASAVDVDISPGVALLHDIRAVFHAKITARVTTGELIAALASMEGRLWGDWNRGRSITPHQLARLLGPWRIGPKTMRFEHGLAKGYALVDFHEAFRRYL